MRLPNVAGKPQNLAGIQAFRRRIERFGDDVTGDAAVRQRRQHVRRRHDDQFDFVGFAGQFGHRHQAFLP